MTGRTLSTERQVYDPNNKRDSPKPISGAIPYLSRSFNKMARDNFAEWNSWSNDGGLSEQYNNFIKFGKLCIYLVGYRAWLFEKKHLRISIRTRAWARAGLTFDWDSNTHNFAFLVNVSGSRVARGDCASKCKFTPDGGIWYLYLTLPADGEVWKNVDMRWGQGVNGGFRGWYSQQCPQNSTTFFLSKLM